MSAYETAFAETVPPPVIAANRALLLQLLATNFLGQNTPAIADVEAQYGEMWAQDAAAMYGYALASAAASTLPPFEPAKPATDPAVTAPKDSARRRNPCPRWPRGPTIRRRPIQGSRWAGSA